MAAGALESGQVSGEGALELDRVLKAAREAGRVSQRALTDVARVLVRLGVVEVSKGRVQLTAEELRERAVRAKEKRLARDRRYRESLRASSPPPPPRSAPTPGEVKAAVKSSVEAARMSAEEKRQQARAAEKRERLAGFVARDVLTAAQAVDSYAKEFPDLAADVTF